MRTWLTRDPALPSGAGPHHPARYRAGDRGRAQGARARSLRARPRAAGPRPRELSAAGGGAGLGTARGRARQGRSRRRRHSRGRDTTRAAVTALTSAAPAARRTRAHASIVAPVVLTSSTRTTRSPATSARAIHRRSANAPLTLSCRASAGRSVCDGVARSAAGHRPPARRAAPASSRA